MSDRAACLSGKCLVRFRLVVLAGVLFSLLCGILPSAAPAQGERRVVRVGVYDNAPKIFLAPDGKPSGIFIDLIAHIARKEGWDLHFVSGSWAEGLDRLRNGEIDLMPDVAYTAERGEIFSFHKTQVLTSWFQAYATRNSGIKTLLDLDGKRVALLEQSVQQEAFERYTKGFGLHITFVSCPDYRTAFEKTAREEADAVITNQLYGSTHAPRYGLVDTAVVFEPSALYFAAKKDRHKDLLDAIDRHLVSLKMEPRSEYYKIMKRWTSEEVRFRWPFWLLMAGLGAAVVLILSLAGSLLLKRQVDARTRELVEINQEMEARIERRTAELAEALEKAQEADRLKSAFLATMSHELRTPLNSIIGFTGIILRERVGPLNEEQKKQLNMVRSSAQHLLALINDVLDISKIEAGQLTLVQEVVDLRKTIEKVEQITRPLADIKGLEMGFEIADEVGSIPGDARRVEQILLNLLSNAIKFTEKGSVKIVCTLDDSNVLVKVIDTGIGIRYEDLGKVFETFRQIDTGLSRKYEGTGLGLSISKRLAELMGGRLWVESIWEVGSTFNVSLPKERSGA